MEDNKIIDLFFARDEEAIRQTEKTYGRKLQSLAFRILLDAQDAEESVSDTYMKAWQTIPPVRPTYFYAYLAKICRFLAMNKLDWKNAEKRKAEILCLTDEMAMCIPDSSGDGLSEEDLGRVISQFLLGISKESRLIFMRRYWFCDSIAEIAKRYAISESKVKMRLHRTRIRLATYLREEGICV